LGGRWTTNSDSSDGPPEMDVPAVAYVRMSTDHQKYSTENQLDVIRKYASAAVFRSCASSRIPVGAGSVSTVARRSRT